MGLFNMKKPSAKSLFSKTTKAMVSSTQSQEQKITHLSSMAERDLKIVHDCTELINSTVNPKVFFSRFYLLQKKLQELSLLEGLVAFSGELPSQILYKIDDQQEEIELAFINRFFNNLQQQVSKLKNESSRIKKADTLFIALLNEKYQLDADMWDLVVKRFQEVTGCPDILQLEALHFTNLEKENTLYSSINDTKNYYSSEADTLIDLCLYDISFAQRLKPFWQKQYKNQELPLYQSFKRLCILYEKRNAYNEGINICVQAIDLGFLKDGTKGQMYARLERLVKKTGVKPSKKILKILEQSKLN